MASSSFILSKRFSIFLSHSGAQKLFSHVLYEKLSLANYSCFFDQDSDFSLRKGDNLSVEIEQAINHCKLAIVIISKEIITSFWPMLEFQQIMARKHNDGHLGFRVYPIFYKLGPADLKNKKNLKVWKTKWKSFSKKQPFDIDLLTYSLAELILIAGSILTSEHTSEFKFIIDVVLPNVFKICPAPQLYFGDDYNYIQGKEGWIEEIEHHFPNLIINKDIQLRKHASILGIHGIHGCGKTTLCKTMVDYYTQHHFPGMCRCLFLPTNKDENLFTKQLKLSMKKFGIAQKETLDDIYDIDEVITMFTQRIKGQNIFLAVDNVRPWSEQHVRNIILSITKQYSQPHNSILKIKVIVTSCSEELLKSMFQAACVEEVSYNVVPMPDITTEAAFKAFLYYSGISACNLNYGIKNSSQVIKSCSFSGSCHPFLLETMSLRLKQVYGSHDQDMNEYIKELKTQEQSKIVQVLRSNYDELDKDLQCIFLDVAVLTRGKIHEDELRRIGMLYKNGNATQLKKQFQRLQYFGLWKVNWICYDEVNHEASLKMEIHDLYMEFARQEAASTNRYLVYPASRSTTEASSTLQPVDANFIRVSRIKLFKSRSPYGKSVNEFKLLLEKCHANDVELLDVDLHDLDISKKEVVELPLELFSQQIHTKRQWPQLRILKLGGLTGIQSIHGLKAAPNLMSLVLQECYDLIEIHDICCLQMLQEVEINQAYELEVLDMGELHYLKCLTMTSCTKLRQLANLKFQSPTLERLSLSRCYNLEDLSGIHNFPALQHLYIQFCLEIQEFPNVILGKLKTLDLAGCLNLKKVMPGAIFLYQKLPNLQVLKLDVDEFDSFCEGLQCTKNRILPSLQKMSHLKTVKLLDFDDIGDLNAALPDLMNLHILDLDGGVCNAPLSNLSCLTNIRSLALRNFPIVDSIPKLSRCTELGVLYLDNFPRLQIVLDLSGCSKLKEVSLFECPVLKSIPELSHLKELLCLRFKNCISLEGLPQLPKSLHCLDVDGCSSLRSIPDLCDLVSLSYLSFSKCVLVESIPGVCQLTYLQTLCLAGCTSLKVLPDLWNLTKLAAVQLRGCSSLERIPNVPSSAWIDVCRHIVHKGGEPKSPTSSSYQ